MSFWAAWNTVEDCLDEIKQKESMNGSSEFEHKTCLLATPSGAYLQAALEAEARGS